MTGRARPLVWLALGAAAVLSTHELVYLLVPQSLVVAELEHATGDPHVERAALAGGALGVVLAVVVLALAVVAVRERLALDGREVVERPRLRPALLAVRFLAFFAATSVAFAYVESTIHWREGLGWHGLHCLVGPVHRDAIPILLALSALVVAFHGACEHLLAYARRLVLAFLPRLPRLLLAAIVRACVARVRGRTELRNGGPRGPPRPAASVSP